MKIELHSWTSPHPYVTQLTTLTDRYNEPTATWPLVSRLAKEDHPAYADMLIEFAGRICYRSEDKMGNAPNFIGARVNEGHEDILEHVSITVLLTDTIANSADHKFVHGIGEIERTIRRWESISKFVYPNMIEHREWYVTANARVWRELCQYSPHIPLIEAIYPVAPQVFKDLLPTPGDGNNAEVLADNQHVLTERDRPEKNLFGSLYHIHPEHESRIPVALAHDTTGIKVTHLGTNIPLLSKKGVVERHATTTFLVEHISRACTHQLVRHRRASFSQESQRYVDLDKGQWQFIMPPSILRTAPDSVRRLRWHELMEEVSFAYGDLRELGVRKEDARFVLPNAIETRLIVTMPHDAWLHFCWLRALDKAAQWEIRALGQVILQFLKTIQPDAFYPLWLNLLDNRERLEVTYD